MADGHQRRRLQFLMVLNLPDVTDLGLLCDDVELLLECYLFVVSLV